MVKTKRNKCRSKARSIVIKIMLINREPDPTILTELKRS